MLKIKGIAPFYRKNETVREIMLDAFFPLMFLLILPTYNYGFRVLYIAGICVVSAMLSEVVACLFLKKSILIADLSSAITGLIISMMLPVTVDVWVAVVTCAVAIMVGKMPFGGIGRTPFNPACVGLAFSIISFPTKIFNYISPESTEKLNSLKIEDYKSVTSITQSLKLGNKPTIEYGDILLGKVAGPIGTTAIILLVLCFVYLVFRHAIRWEIPVAFIGAIALYSLIAPRINSGRVDSLVFELLSGSAIFCAIFMATENTSSPKTSLGRIFYGFVGGIVTMIFRYYGVYEQGAVFAILFINAISMSFDKLSLYLTKKVGGL